MTSFTPTSNIAELQNNTEELANDRTFGRGNPSQYDGIARVIQIVSQRL
jgi:hypothetical protein